VAAIGYGTLGVLSRFAADDGISTIAFVTWRAMLGALVLVVAVSLLLGFGVIRSVRFADVPARHWLQIGTLAMLNVVINLAVFSGFEHASIALVLICFYTYPVIVAVAATRVYHEPLTPLRMSALVLATAGLVLVVAAPMLDEGQADVGVVGLLLGLLAAVAQAVHALIAGRGYSSLPAPQAAVALSVIQAVGFVGVALLSGTATALAEPVSLGDAWAPIVLAATIGLAIPTAAVLAGYRRLGPTRASILMLLEPVVAVLLAALLLSERPAVVQLVGGALVLAGSLLAQVHRQPVPEPSLRPA
jgi:drug/metabolite transporter (DMT)-like permease